MTDKETMKLALEALEWMVANDDTNEGDEPVERLGGQSWNEYNAYWLDGLNNSRAAITAIKQALAAQQEPLEYWNAVEGWVKIDEVREHFDSVGCGTIYKTAGEDRVPVYTTPPAAQRKPLPAPVPPTGVKGYAMALNEVALKLRKRYEHDLLSTPLWAEFEKARNKLARSVAAPPAQPAVPKGWKLVPVEPTDEMLDAAQVVVTDICRVDADRVYAAMLNNVSEKGQP